MLMDISLKYVTAIYGRQINPLTTGDNISCQVVAVSAAGDEIFRLCGRIAQGIRLTHLKYPGVNGK